MEEVLHKTLKSPGHIAPADSGEFTGIMGDVNTYVSEMMAKFITGKEPLANYAQFTNRIKQMNIDKAIVIQQAALKRFNAR